MIRSVLLRGASAGALTIAVIFPALAQQSLPTLEIGKQKKVMHAPAKVKLEPRMGAGRGDRGKGHAVGGAAGSGSDAILGASLGGGAGAGGYGGAGPQQDPYNRSYVLQNASTGTKTNTPVMDTPLNVQSITQQVLRDQQAITLEQAVQNVSGATVAGGGALGNGTPYSSIVLRGFAATALFRDGFRNDITNTPVDGASSLQFANIASVEVLKGPAAILYGLSEPGGIVNIITKEPLNAPYYSVNQQIGSFGLYRTSADATGPVTQDGAWLYRMNMSYENNGAPQGGPVDLVHGQNIFLAPVLKWNIDPNTWVKLEAQYSANRIGIFYPYTPIFDGDFVSVPRNRNYGESAPNIQNTFFSALTWSHQFDNDWSMKQQVAYNRTDLYAKFIFPNGFEIPADVPVVDRFLFPEWDQATTFSTNVDIVGHVDTFGAKHTLLLGGDVYWYNYGRRQLFDLGPPSQIGLVDPVHPGMPFIGPLAPSFAFSGTLDTAGLYLQDQIKLPYNFIVLAGARYQYIHQTNEQNFFLPPSQTLVPPETDSALTPRFGLLWRPQEWLSFYGNYTEGFGPNAGVFVYPGTPAPPTSAKEWESGVKVELFDGRLRATADYYDLTKTNVPIQDPAHPNFSILNGEARSKGVELDIQGELAPGWSVIASYANQDVRTTKAGDSTYFLIGQRFPNIPRNLASLWSTYEFQDDMLKGWKIGGGVVYRDAQPVASFEGNFKGPMTAGHAILNAMAAYSFKLADTKMTAQVNVSNVLNTTYYGESVVYGSSAPAPGYSYGYRSYGAPLTVLGSLTAELDKGAKPAPWLLPVPTDSSPPAHNWTGLYLGAHAGYGWGDNSGVGYVATMGGLAATGPLADAQGVIGGGHAGYNHQWGDWVAGLEGAIDGAGLSKDVPLGVVDGTGATPGGSLTETFHASLQGSIRARFGYALDRLLIFGAGGAAFAGFSSQLGLSGLDASGPFFAAGKSSTTRTGWTAGGGVGYAVNSHWSLLAEYRYSNFGRMRDVPEPAPIGAIFAVNRYLDQNQVQVGFSYKLGGSDPEVVSAPRIVKGPSLADNTAFKPAVAPPPVPPAPIDWTGFYAGVQIGYGYGDNNGSITYATPGGLWGQSSLNSSAIVSGGPASSNGDAVGVIGEAHVGYNRQFDRWVVGVEGAVDPTLLNRRLSILVPNTAADPGGALGVGATANGAIWSPIQGSVRARAGFALDRLLFYGAGGLAIGAFGSSFQLYGIDLNLAPFYAGAMRSSTRVGWTAGGGVEYAVNPHWSVRGEYRYSDFGHLADCPAATSAGAFFAADRHLDQNQVQVGLSYKFGEVARAAPVGGY